MDFFDKSTTMDWTEFNLDDPNACASIFVLIQTSLRDLLMPKYSGVRDGGDCDHEKTHAFLRGVADKFPLNSCFEKIYLSTQYTEGNKKDDIDGDVEKDDEQKKRESTERRRKQMQRQRLDGFVYLLNAVVSEFVFAPEDPMEPYTNPSLEDGSAQLAEMLFREAIMRQVLCPFLGRLHSEKAQAKQIITGRQESSSSQSSSGLGRRRRKRRKVEDYQLKLPHDLEVSIDDVLNRK